MIGPYAYTPYIWPMLVMTAMLSTMAAYAWRRRMIPAATPFVAGALLWAVWAFGAAMELAAVGPGTKLAWFQLQGATKLPIVTFQMIFVLVYTGQQRWLTRASIALLALINAIYILAIATNPAHHLFWTDLRVAETVSMSPGPLLWVMFALGLVLSASAGAALVWLFIRFPRHRPFAGLILGAALATRVAAGLDARYLNSLALLDVTLFASMLPATVYFLALFRFRILGVVPVGRGMAIERMANGVLILDAEDRIADVNPAARELLALPSDDIIGSEASLALAAYPDLLALLQRGAVQGEDLVLDRDGGRRYLHVHASSLVSPRGFNLGHLVLLHDVTDQATARELLAQKERTLAVLGERERLARELHDNLGQVFAFINAQGQAARRLLAQGDAATVDGYLARLVEVAEEADTDIRESILGLRVALPDQGLFPALATYLQQYERRHGIRTTWSWPDSLGEGAFDPGVEVQLLRIIQEALTNARKHARARHIDVTFAAQDEQARVTVRDDGRGFDPAHVAGSSRDRVGLRVMRERAEEVGGSLDLRSEPGEGTRVIVTVPLKRGPNTYGGKEGEGYARAVG